MESHKTGYFLIIFKIKPLNIVKLGNFHTESNCVRQITWNEIDEIQNA